jgi:hypothetical protein
MNLTIVREGDYLLLSWQVVPGATDYEVWRTGPNATIRRKIATVGKVLEPHPGDLWTGPTSVKLRLRCPGTWTFWVVADFADGSTEESASWGFTDSQEMDSEHRALMLGTPEVI